MIRMGKSIRHKWVKSQNSTIYPASVAEQASLCLTRSEDNFPVTDNHKVVETKVKRLPMSCHNLKCL